MKEPLVDSTYIKLDLKPKFIVISDDPQLQDLTLSVIGELGFDVDEVPVFQAKSQLSGMLVTDECIVIVDIDNRDDFEVLVSIIRPMSDFRLLLLIPRNKTQEILKDYPPGIERFLGCYVTKPVYDGELRAFLKRMREMVRR